VIYGPTVIQRKDLRSFAINSIIYQEIFLLNIKDNYVDLKANSFKKYKEKY